MRARKKNVISLVWDVCFWCFAVIGWAIFLALITFLVLLDRALDRLIMG